MSSCFRRISAERLRDDRGSALITVVLVSFLLITMMTLTMQSGVQSARTAARGKNFDVALATAEAGVDASMARIQASGGAFTGQATGQVATGTYTSSVTRSADGFVIDVTGNAGGQELGRTRRVRATLGPPLSIAYALQSTTSVELKNTDTIQGDVWANDSVLLEHGNTVRGSVTAAQGWVLLKQGSSVEGNVWSGGFHSTAGWAMSLENGATIGGWAKASVSDPMTACPAGGSYAIRLGGGNVIDGAVTTCDEVVGGAPTGVYTPNVFTQAAAPKPLPVFTFNRYNYDQTSYAEFTSVSEFQAWLDAHSTSVTGTFHVTDPNPSQNVRIDLTNVVVTGDTTIVTNAPVFTNGISDDASSKVFTVVSHYRPPTGAACTVNQDASECAIHVKNNFDPSCRTAVLLYADRGPVAVKNNQKTCGSVVADSILVKNNQELTYDERLARAVGFGASSYEIVRWEEVPS